MTSQVTDTQRRKLETALAAALLLRYRYALAQTYRRLGVDTEPVVSADAEQFIQNAAKQRALDVQSGINTRLDAAKQKAADMTPDDADQLLVSLRQEMEQHNANSLVPNILSQIDHQAQYDGYSSTTTADGMKALDATQWVWTRGSGSDEPDSCQDAADASPASYNALVDAASGAPPIHNGCLCSITPA